VLLALGVVLAGGTWWWFERNFERQTRQVEQGQSAEARRNPFLAAERFLNRLGIDARSASARNCCARRRRSPTCSSSTGCRR
jgi:hypothetical protein